MQLSEYKVKELETTDIVKILCLIFVVLGHSCVIYTGTSWGNNIAVYDSSFLGAINKFVASFHTQAFTAASGYLLTYLYDEQGKYKDFKGAVTHRFKRLIIPYVFISILWAIPIGYYFEKLNLSLIVRNYVLMVNPAQLWFLPMLFAVWFLFLLVHPNKKKTISTILILICLYYASILLSNYLPIGIFQIKNIMKYMLYFYFGIIIRRYNFRFNKYFILYLALELITTALLFYINEKYISYLQPVWGCTGILFVFSLCFTFLHKFVHSSIFKVVKENTMGVYLVHQQIMYILIHLLNRKTVFPIFTVILSFTFCLVFSFMAVILIRRFSIGRYILGG